MMVTWDDSESEKSNIFDNEKANICLMVDTYDKVEVKTCSTSYTSYCASSDDEEDMPTYDVLLQNYHMISLQCKRFKEKFKVFTSENI